MSRVDAMCNHLQLNISAATREQLQVSQPWSPANVRRVSVNKEHYNQNKPKMQQMMAHIKTKAEAAGYTTRFCYGGYLELSMTPKPTKRKREL